MGGGQCRVKDKKMGKGVCEGKKMRKITVGGEESWKRVRKERGRGEERDEGGEATEFILDCHFSSRERDTERGRENKSSAKICLLVSMATAGYYPQPLFIMMGSDFREGGRDRERGTERGWTERSGLLFTFGSKE